ANLNNILFAGMACLDFFLFNRFILPSPIETSSDTPSTASLMSLEDRETVELPSLQNAVANGYHLYSIDGIKRVELPSAELVVASGFELIGKFQPTQKKFYDKFRSIMARVPVVASVFG